MLPRLARRHYGGNTLNIVFWKFLLVGVINLLYAASLAPRGGVRRAVLPCTLRRKGILLPALLATLFTAATNTCFATAYMTTAAANAVVLIEINPLWGAALGVARGVAGALAGALVGPGLVGPGLVSPGLVGTTRPKTS